MEVDCHREVPVSRFPTGLSPFNRFCFPSPLLAVESILSSPGLQGVVLRRSTVLLLRKVVMSPPAPPTEQPFRHFSHRLFQYVPSHDYSSLFPLNLDRSLFSPSEPASSSKLFSCPRVPALSTRATPTFYYAMFFLWTPRDLYLLMKIHLFIFRARCFPSPPSMPSLLNSITKF